jgi:hypothetical protein
VCGDASVLEQAAIARDAAAREASVMSRRRESWHPAPAVETDELLTAMFGERLRQEREQMQEPVPGCSERCCSRLPVEVDDGCPVWGVLMALGSEIVVVLAVLALIWAASRGLRW